MEVWLNNEKDNEIFRFPVVPMPLGVEGEAGIDSVSITAKGKVNVYAGIEPASIQLESFFPRVYYPYCNYRDFPTPGKCVELIEKWMHSGAKLRFIVTNTDINMEVIIASFSHKFQDGTGNIYYSMKLSEKVSISAPEWTPPVDVKKLQANAKKSVKNVKTAVKNAKRVSVKSKNKTHTVKHGESLWSIAKSEYGDGSKWKQIKNNANNQNKYPKLKTSNVIYSGWVLSL